MHTLLIMDNEQETMIAEFAIQTGTMRNLKAQVCT